MSTNENENQQVPEESMLDFYRSLNSSYRAQEEELLTLSIKSGVVPQVLRYGIMNNVNRGAILGTDGGSYYFTYPPNGEFRLVKADTDTKKWEANKLLKSCRLGCDLIKSKDDKEPVTDKDLEDEEKGESGPPDTVSEEQNIKDQHRLITEQHPGSAASATPDMGDTEQRWHGGEEAQMQRSMEDAQAANAWSYNDLLKGLGQQLQSSALDRIRQPSDKEKQFMTEVLGRSPQDIEEGNTFLSGMQRANMNKWLTRSMRAGTSSLAKWLKKNTDNE